MNEAMEQSEIKPDEDENSVCASRKDKSTFQPGPDINKNSVSKTCKTILNFPKTQNEVISQTSELLEHNDNPFCSGGGDAVTSNWQGDSVIVSSSHTDTSDTNQSSEDVRVEQEKMTTVSGLPTSTCPPCSEMMQSSSVQLSSGFANVPNLDLLGYSDDEEEGESFYIELGEDNEDTFPKGDYGSDDGELIARGVRDTKPAFSVPSIVNSGSRLFLNRELSHITLHGDDLTVGSTAPRESFTSDLQEDCAPVCQTPLKPVNVVHYVRQGSIEDLEEFVKKSVYRALPNTGLLVNEKLNPVKSGSEWYYRENKEYRILEGIQHNSVCLCEDHKSHFKFVRKQRKRVKFEGQKKSVLVPLLHHESPYMMDIYGLIVLNEEIHLFMEYCIGGHLEHDTTSSVIDTVNILSQLLQSLSYIHSRGLVHGDIKPENICFRIPKDFTSLCLIDFEFVKTQESQPQFKGYTSQFLPPWWEAIKKAESFSPLLLTMDLWAAACVAICLLTSKRPWSNEVKDFKKQCKKCQAMKCTCSNILRQLMNHISSYGHNILKHLDRNILVKTNDGKLLWNTLIYLTKQQPGDMDYSRADQAYKILNGEDAEVETVEIEIQYRGRLLHRTVVDQGITVGRVLQKQEVQQKLNAQMKRKKWTLVQPPSDYKIISNACIITVQKGDSGVKKLMDLLHLR